MLGGGAAVTALNSCEASDPPVRYYIDASRLILHGP